MHRRDKEGIAIYFNTEHRGSFSPVFAGIDKERLVIYDTHDPAEIFDRVENDIKAMVQDGMPLRMIIIDSLTNIQGVKRINAESVTNHLMGDHALTLQIGLSKLVPFCKRNGILLIATEQVRANMDAGSYGPKEKMAATFATKHSFEYFVSLKRAGAAEDKMDMEGKTFEEEDMKDARGNKLLNGHKIFAKCEASSIGPAGRSAVFTIDYDKGIINQHEEIFFLGKNTGIIQLEGTKTYVFGKERFNGKKECALAIRDNPDMAIAILDQVRQLDTRG
jgi:RecA/RadA recombinase